MDGCVFFERKTPKPRPTLYPLSPARTIFLRGGMVPTRLRCRFTIKKLYGYPLFDASTRIGWGGYPLRNRRRYTVPPVVVVPVVVPVEVTGLYAKPSQYLRKLSAILRLLCSLCFRPVCACAILSRCCCGISLRHCLLAIV